MSPFEIRRGPVAVIASVVLIIGLSACSGSTGGSVSAPAGGTQAPRPSLAPAESTACLDLAQLGDLGETVSGAMQTVTDDLKAGNVAGAKTAAATTAKALRSLAEYVMAARPQAATKLRGAADAVDEVAKTFPAGVDRLSQAQQDLNDAFKESKAAACPS